MTESRIKPPFPFTGYCYDFGQGAYLKPEFVKVAIRLAADSGYTHFLAYLENLIRLPCLEKACPASAYTLEQWREFDAVAVAAGIELVPSLTTIGHSRAICRAYPELTGGEGLELDPTTTAAHDWVERGLREFCAVSTASYFLICGDEWQVPNHLLARPELDPGELWSRQINHAAACLTGLKRTPIVWHDMLMHYPQALERLSRDVVIAFWFYDEDSDYPVIRTLKELGFRVLMAAGLSGEASLNRRRIRGMQTALAAARRHHADGFFMTSWEDCRWEKQQLNIPMVARLLRAEPVPAAMLDAISWSEVLRQVPEAHPFRQSLAADCRNALTDPAWNDFPEYREWLLAMLTNDIAKANAISATYLGPDSPVLAPPVPPPPSPPETPPPKLPRHLRNLPYRPEVIHLEVSMPENAGEVVRFANGEESFYVYPKFGAVMQGWKLRNEWIIPHNLPETLKTLSALPGGYRSYAAVCGFRPIWALGTQHNPCILWNQPWDYRVTETEQTAMAVEFYRDFPHAEIRYRIRIRQGVPGFEFTATAVNKLPIVHAAFNWNLVLPLAAADLDGMKLIWTENNNEKQTTLMEQRESFFRIPATNGLKICKPAWTLTVETPADQTAGFFTDWSVSGKFLTPDLHGVYRRLGPGESCTVTWRFAAVRHDPSPSITVI